MTTKQVLMPTAVLGGSNQHPVSFTLDNQAEKNLI